MNKKTIAFFEVKPWETKILKKEFKDCNTLFFKERINDVNIKEFDKAEIISTFIYSKVDSKIINKLHKLKMISTRSTGFDHIDIQKCKKKHIVVSNVPYYGENTVAEHTFALILTISRNIHKFYARVKNRNFDIKGLMGFDIKGKTIGVIGAGHIGLNVIKIAKGFGMNVIAFDTRKDEFISNVLGFEYVSLDQLLKKSDIVTIHVPLNKHTYHLINKDNIKLMKKGSILINTSRGEVVDTDAIIYALDHKILKGAGLDVIEGESLLKDESQAINETQKIKEILKDFNILDRDNVVYTPHIAFYSKEALMRILKTTIENIKSFMDGNSINTVF